MSKKAFPFDDSDEGIKTIARMLTENKKYHVPEATLVSMLKARCSGFLVDEDILGPILEDLENELMGMTWKIID
jgi:hypothetical protein